MRSLLFLLMSTTVCFSAGSDQLDSNIRTPTLKELKAKTKDMSNFYGDVGSRIECGKPKSNAEKIICSDPYLLKTAILNAQSQVYAYENATKTEADHKTYKIKLPQKCKDKACIIRFFSEEINGDLGGESPFDVNWIGLN